jgi:hypothetical protein
MKLLPQLQRESDLLAKDLRQSIADKGMRATGDTERRIRSEAGEEGFRVLGPDYIDDLERGVKPGTKVDLSRLSAWMKARGIESDPRRLQNSLFKRGSRLFRGEDPRFSGTTSGVLSDVLTQTRLDGIRMRLGRTMLSEVKTGLLTAIEP